MFYWCWCFYECTVLNKKVNVAHNTVLGKIGFGFIPENTNTILTPHVGSLLLAKVLILDLVVRLIEG